MENSATLWLVGNFGDAKINAYDQTAGIVCTLNSKNARRWSTPGLWELDFGDGTTARPSASC